MLRTSDLVQGKHQKSYTVDVEEQRSGVMIREKHSQQLADTDTNILKFSSALVLLSACGAHTKLLSTANASGG